MELQEKKVEKEGSNLLGRPKFSELPNGRFKCVETGHELVGKDRDSYAQSKRCRLGLIDYALSRNKPPLNMFTQDPSCRSKLICKLTGDKVNKSEEHLWKHINGKRFLNRLEKEEEEKLGQTDFENVEGKEILDEVANGKPDKAKKKKEKKDKQKRKEKDKEKLADQSDIGRVEDGDNEKVDFWMPPVGARWDFDDGGDRWGSDIESGPETADEGPESAEETGLDDHLEDDCNKPKEAFNRKKRASADSGTGDIVSKKRKKKKNKKSSA